MPGRGQDGRAARAGAPFSLAGVPLLSATRQERKAQQRAKAADRAFFGANPHAGSYVRRYYPGEVARAMREGYPETPVAVAVALIGPGMYARCAVFPGESRAGARLVAEQRAKMLRHWLVPA